MSQGTGYQLGKAEIYGNEKEKILQRFAKPHYGVGIQIKFSLRRLKVDRA